MAKFSGARRAHGRAASSRRCGRSTRTASSAAGRRPFLPARRLRPRCCRRWSACGAVEPLHRFVARHFEHPRVREAFSFHSLFIGGDPYRVPAIYGALVYLQVLDGGWYADGGVYSIVEAMARTLDVRCGEPVEAHRARRRPRDGRAARGRRAARRRRRRLQRRRAAHARAARAAAPPLRAACARRCRASCSTSARDRAFERSCTTRCSSGTATATSSAAVTRGGELPAHVTRPTSTRRRAPSRRWRAPGGDSLAVLLPVPEPARPASTGSARPTGCATRWSPTSRRRSGWTGLRRVDRGRAPHDAARLRARARARSTATRSPTEPTLHQSAYFRAAQPRPARRGPLPRRRRHAPGRRHPGRAARRRGHRRPGRRGPSRRARRRRRAHERHRARAVLAEARATTQRVARTFALACRLLPRARARRRLPALPRLPHARRPRRRRPAGRRGARRRRRGLVRGAPAGATREVAILDEPRRAATRSRATRCATSAPACARTSPAERVRDRGRPRPLLLPRRRDRRRRDGARCSARAIPCARARRPPRSAWRCSARTSCATSTRTAPPAASTSPGRPSRASAVARPGAREALLRDQIARADALYEQGVAGIAAAAARAAGRSPPRPAMYREILRQIEREGYGARAGRAVVPRRRKLADRGAPRRARRAESGGGTPAVPAWPTPSVDAAARRRGSRAVAALAVVARRVARRGGCRRGRRRRRSGGARRARGGAPAAEPPAAARAAARRPRSIFPDRRVVAFYGSPAGRRARRARHRHARRARRAGSQRQARAYERKTRPVLPALELIAVVANADAGDGRPLPHAPARRGHPPLPARRAPGQGAAAARHPARPRRTSSRRRRGCEKWLREPDVGLALDPEWRDAARAGPGPGHRLASSAREVNATSAWLDQLVASATTCRRSCSSSTSSPTTWSTTGRAQGRATGSRWCLTPTASAARRSRSRSTARSPQRRAGVPPGFKLFYEEDTDLMTPRRGAAAAARRRTSSSTSERCGPRAPARRPSRRRRSPTARRAGAAARRPRPRARSSCSCSRPRPPRRCEARGARRGAAPVAAAGALGFAAELVGVATGRPFGHYRYTDRLGPRVGGVPLLAAAAWAMMAARRGSWPGCSRAGGRCGCRSRPAR